MTIIPPNDVEAERAVLGTIISFPSCLPRARAILNGGAAFYSSSHAAIYKTMEVLADDGIAPDLVTITQRLKISGSIECVEGGAVYLAGLISDGFTDANIEYHAGRVWEMHRRRETIAEAKRTADAARDLSTPFEGVARRETAYPEIVDAANFLAEKIESPPEVIAGVLHKGGKLIYGGPSKTFKSWSLIDLCCSVATGMPWLGLETTPGRALYINFELQDFAVQRRISAILQAKGVELPAGAFDVWNLRGYSCPLTRLIDSLIRQIESRSYSLITVDPIYKTLDGRDENSAGDIGAVCNEIEAVTVKTEAACAWGAHYAKGNASGKSHIDRMSGSGVWARDPDAILTATSHEIENIFTVDMTLRNFPPQPQFCVRWEYPLMVRDSADPSKLRQPGGSAQKYSERDAMACFAEGMTSRDWERACSESVGMGHTTFYTLKALLLSTNKIIWSGKSLHYNPANTSK